MKTNFWAKTILSVYRYLERIAGAIDKLVEQNAMNSYYYFTGASQDNGVMATSERIIDLSERKVTLINLKVLTEQALLNCDKTLARILIKRYIDCEKGEDIAKRFNLSTRTYFRRLNQGEEQFYNYFAIQGYNEKTLPLFLKDEKWIKEVYDKFVSIAENKAKEENFEELIKVN